MSRNPRGGTSSTPSGAPGATVFVAEDQREALLKPQIHDARHAGRDGTYTFDGILADIYLACADRPTTAAAVRERLRLDRPVGYVEEVLGEFQRRGLIFRDERLAVALAIPAVPGR